MRKNEKITLEITAMSHDGMGIGRHEGMAVFVSGTAVGDTAIVLIVKVLKRFCFGKALEIISPSPDRTTPDCTAFSRCGGCCYRHISYAAECSVKQQRVIDSVERIGKLSTNILPIIGADRTDGYRNKAQYPVGMREDGSLYCGFYSLHSHRIVECEEGCALQPPEFQAICDAVLERCRVSGVTAYNEQRHTGLLRHIYLRRCASGDILLCLVVNGDSLPDEAAIVRAAIGANKHIVSIILNENREKTNVIMGKKCRTLYGSDSIEDTLCGVRVRINPLSFYQVNRDMAQRLYKIAADYAKPHDKILLDLYCGAGTIGLSMARAAQRVIGVELVPQAVEDARYNAAINGIDNAEFICASADVAAASLASKGLRPDVVIIDPPRKGAGETVVSSIANGFSPERVVYVSCDAATLARDLALFAEYGYVTQQIQPVDMFPRTAHVECVALLLKK